MTQSKSMIFLDRVLTFNVVHIQLYLWIIRFHVPLGILHLNKHIHDILSILHELHVYMCEANIIEKSHDCHVTHLFLSHC